MEVGRKKEPELLPYEKSEPRTRRRAGLDIEEVYLRRYDALMKSMAARAGGLPRAQAAPVQVWQFVDYALGFAREYPDRQIWSAGYSNDVFGYLPSRRVREEGGYEAADAMVYYGRPGPFTSDVEERIVREVHRLVR